MKTIGLIGFGRFGKLIVKFISKDFAIKIYDKKITKKALNIWKKEHIPQLLRNNIKLDTLNKVCGSKIILLAIPISSFELVSQKIANTVQPHTLIMDFCSVKKYPLTILQKQLPKSCYILGTHPLFGPDSAGNELTNKKIILCPKRIQKKLFNDVFDYLKSLGLKVIVSTDDQHDKRTAYTLCLTQFIGRGLEKFQMKEEEFDTFTFNELLHIRNVALNDTKQLFCDMQSYNSYAKDMRKKLLNDFKGVEKMLNSK